MGQDKTVLQKSTSGMYHRGPERSAVKHTFASPVLSQSAQQLSDKDVSVDLGLVHKCENYLSVIFMAYLKISKVQSLPDSHNLTLV